MRRFIVEALADALVLLVIILLLSIPTVSQPFPFGPDSAPILQLRGAGVLRVPASPAMILVLTERFVRPVIVAFTGRLILSTMGLFLIAANALVLWVASLLAPDIAVIAQPAPAVARRDRRAVHDPDLGRSTRCSGSTGRGSPRTARRPRSGGSSSRCPRRAAT